MTQTVERNRATNLLLERPDTTDGASMWSLVKDSKVLDQNSAYLYITIGAFFRESSVVVRDDEGDLAGMVTGYRLPNQPNTLFIWQVAVDPGYRGQGLAGKMFADILKRPEMEEVNKIKTTVSPSNRPSMRMFEKLADRLDADININEGFSADLFPGDNHEDERMLNIGPF